MRYLVPVLTVLATFIPHALSQQTDERSSERIENPEVPDKSGKRPDLEEVSQRIIDRTNEFRKQEGRDPVKADKRLTAAARYFANYMAKNDVYGHTADGNRPAERAKKHGYDLCIVLENIAYAFDSSGFEIEQLTNEFVVGWKESPGHRKNMLDRDVTETGVAVARSESTGYYYAVQMFGRPKSASIEFRVKNETSQTFEYRLAERTYMLQPRYTRTHIVCRPPEVKFLWSKKENEAEAVKPKNGELLVVTKSGEKWSIEKKGSSRK